MKRARFSEEQIISVLKEAEAGAKTFAAAGFFWKRRIGWSEEFGRSARINVDYAGAWAAKRWRFYERGNRYVSVRPHD